MPTKITVIYENPMDPERFEASYMDQLNLAKSLPGVQRWESSKVWPKEDRSPTPAYRVLDLYFADYDSASRAVATKEAAALLSAIDAAATGGVRILFLDIDCA